VDNKDENLLIRIDERTQSLQTSMKRLEVTMASNYVPYADFKVLKERVDLISKIVLTSIGVVLTTLLGAIVAFFIRTPL
jgi:hypothetical protein